MNSTSTVPPTCLMQIGERDNKICICLRETSELTEKTRYTTLSHRWSGDLPRLLVSNYELFKEAIPLDRLSRIFLEAIQFTQFLGVEYIWIDALCIIQDSPSDWELEAPCMDRVYANSYLNIAATGSIAGDENLFRHSKHSPLSIVPCRIPMNDKSVPRKLMFARDPSLWIDQVSRRHLNCRGWVLQETLLAPRVLYFAQEQIFWECHSLAACQFFPRGIPGDIHYDNLREWRGLLAGHEGSDLNSLQFLSLWDKIIRRFSSRNLTVPSDKLVALSGIARLFCDLTSRRHYQYLAGLWREGLLGQLLWETDGKNHSRCRTYRAPSWSWASLDGSCRRFNRMNEHDDRCEFLARILGVHNFCKMDPFGPILHGYLRIQGPICRVEIKSGRAE